MYLTCSKKLTGGQLSLGIHKKLKSKTKNKMMSVIGRVQSRYHEGSPVGKEVYGGKNLMKRYVLARSEGVMDDESVDDDRDGLING